MQESTSGRAIYRYGRNRGVTRRSQRLDVTLALVEEQHSHDRISVAAARANASEDRSAESPGE